MENDAGCASNDDTHLKNMNPTASQDILEVGTVISGSVRLFQASPWRLFFYFCKWKPSIGTRTI